MQRGGAAGYSQFYFSKARKPPTTASLVAKALLKVGSTAMAPVNPNGQQLAYPKSRISRVGQMAKRVVIKTTDSLRMVKPSPKRTVVKSPSEGASKVSRSGLSGTKLPLINH